ncbi:MAG: hypothetical protein M9964_05925 [Solirubrobacterales bacterium]|nr:hypothetical protein [Solirubrobacterales bacterium]
MQSTGARVTIAVAAIAVVVIGFIALSGGDDSDDSTTATTATTSTTSADTTAGGDTTEKKPQKPESQVPVIEVKNGEPVGGVQDLTFNEGDTIRFDVDSDTAAEVHFHGYDVGQEVEAGGSTEFKVPATITGVFEVELEETATQIAQITVNP